MNSQNFIRHVLPAVAVIVTVAIQLAPATAQVESLAEQFKAPPRECRPETWFHLIGGNVSKERLTTDLEAVAAAGLQGIQLFHGRGHKWPGVSPQIQSLSPAWESIIEHMANETRRLELHFTMQNCPGWAMSGGPWITPDKAMRISFGVDETARRGTYHCPSPPQPNRSRGATTVTSPYWPFPPPGDDGQCALPSH